MPERARLHYATSYAHISTDDRTRFTPYSIVVELLAAAEAVAHLDVLVREVVRAARERERNEHSNARIAAPA